MVDIDLETDTIQWQWYYPKAGCFVNSKTRVIDTAALVDGFTAGRKPVQAWCDFFNDEFVYCWELDVGDPVGSVPLDFHPTILANLRAILKAKRSGKAKQSASQPPVESGVEDLASEEAGPSSRASAE